MTLKELRMWHWRQALDYQRCANELVQRGPKTRNTERFQVALNHARIADFHRQCVLCLNDHVPGTAEADCASEDEFLAPLRNNPDAVVGKELPLRSNKPSER